MPATPEPLPTPFKHWMLREIYEQPAALSATLEACIGQDDFLDSTGAIRGWIAAAPEVVIAASGSSRHAGLIAELLIEDLSGLAVEVEYASEYTYRSALGLKNASVLVISQSGETVDTLAALRQAKRLGRTTLAITNVANSSMTRDADVSFPTLAGRERAVPATKSFTTQVLNVYLLALLAAEVRGTMTSDERRMRLSAVRALPGLVERQLQGWEQTLRQVVAAVADAKAFLFVGRGVHYPIAREGALKLKESSYLHAEGYPSGELKHGPNALVSDTLPLVMLATKDTRDSGSMERYARTLQLMADMRKQGARIIALANTGDSEVAALSTHLVTLDETDDALLAICEVIPLQMLAYFMADSNGIDVDRPRNLNKAVLTE